MFDSIRPPIIYYPNSLNEFFKIFKRFPDSLLIAGGTFFISSEFENMGPSPIIIFLTQIEELTKIYKTERYIEIGACVTLSNILDLGSAALPKLLIQCIRNISSMPVRNLATVGGNLCVKKRKMDLTYILSLMDAKIEIKTVGNTINSRWISINQLLNSPKESYPEKNQLITRIRLYEINWNISSYYKITDKNGSSFIFCGLATAEKNGLADFRFLVGLDSDTLIRNRSLEMNLIGKPLPLQKKEIYQFSQMYIKELELNDLSKETIQSFIENFLFKIQDFFYDELSK